MYGEFGNLEGYMVQIFFLSKVNGEIIVNCIMFLGDGVTSIN